MFWPALLWRHLAATVSYKTDFPLPRAIMEYLMQHHQHCSVSTLKYEVEPGVWNTLKASKYDPKRTSVLQILVTILIFAIKWRFWSQKSSMDVLMVWLKNLLQIKWNQSVSEFSSFSLSLSCPFFSSDSIFKVILNIFLKN
jgi:hypothetical protein